MSGRIWKFGDGIDTDVLAPGRYMKGSVEELAQHCLETIRPEFASSVVKGDFVVAGENFGIGSSREQAAQALSILGVHAVIASSFGGIFYRNAFNLGLLAIVCADVEKLADGETLSLDPYGGTLTNESQNMTLSCTPVPDHLMAIVQDGGLINHLEKSDHWRSNNKNILNRTVAPAHQVGDKK